MIGQYSSKFLKFSNKGVLCWTCPFLFLPLYKRFVSCDEVHYNCFPYIARNIFNSCFHITSTVSRISVWNNYSFVSHRSQFYKCVYLPPSFDPWPFNYYYQRSILSVSTILSVYRYVILKSIFPKPWLGHWLFQSLHEKNTSKIDYI